MDWQRFVASYGWRANGHHLAQVVGQPVEVVLKLRDTGICRRLKRARTFDELFQLWHGRPPRDEEWPKPRRRHGKGYEWLQNELALLATLVGTIGKAQIAQALTARLQRATGDRHAERSQQAVQVAINRIGLVSRDVLGGITAPAAAREIGSYSTVHHAIRSGRLTPFRIGKLWVIPHDQWQRFKADRPPPPAGYVMLSSIRQRLGISSDAKLPEYAAMGYIPTAVLCNPKLGAGHSSSVRGSWYVDRRVALKLLADRRAGRPMPWFGKPTLSNLKVTWKLLQERRHPDDCEACRKIWGRGGFPTDFDDYAKRYPPLDLGAKKHLTRVWTPGLRPAEVAKLAGVPIYRVKRAIENGALSASKRRRIVYVSRTDAQRWKARRCPTGAGETSWVSLNTAASRYDFEPSELSRLIRHGKLRSKVGTNGPQRGVTYVLRQQLAELRQKTGYSHTEAARKVGVSVAQLRGLLRGTGWRADGRVTLLVLQAAIKRVQSRQGYTVEEAAQAIGRTVKWVRARILDGTVRLTRAPWDKHRPYLTEPMLQRLKQARRSPNKRRVLNGNWLLLSSAAAEAGVSIGTLIRWADEKRLVPRRSAKGLRYHRRAVRACARRHWQNQRFKRAVPPAWLQETA